MAYTAEKPPLQETSDDLRNRIPGWGADLDPRDRPSVPRERFDPAASGAHWDFPERQPERWPRERSVEHAFLTPVFGTAQPPKVCPGRSGSCPTPGTAKAGPPTGCSWSSPTGSTRWRST